MNIKKILDEHNLWLQTGGKEGARADLRGANLSGVNLRYVTLNDADLRGANLRYADLRYANLNDADLRGANLRYAYLNDAYLHGANLCYADLRYANLGGANLGGANLHGADLQGAVFYGAKGIIQWQAPQGERRICYSVKYDDCVMHKLGCFWRATDEAVKAIRKKYGAGSLYEKFLSMQVEGLEGE
jgi:hypothetical protein